MKQFFLTVAGVFVGLLLFVVGVPFLLIAMAAGAARPAPVPAHAVLQLDLRNGLTDQEPKSPFAAFGSSGGSVISVIETLRRAEKDDKVKAILVRLPEGGVAPAAADELRLAFKHFREVGKKPIYAHSQGLYPSGMVTSTYMLGAATSEFWMQPDSSFQAVGISSESMFFKRFFDKYGVKAEYEQRYEYKNAVNPYLHSDYTPAHRESTLSWMGSVYRTALTSAAVDRKQDPTKLMKTLEGGPYIAQEAQAKGLIDKVGQVSDIQAFALEKAGKGAKLLDFDDYASRSKPTAVKSGPAIAVIGAEGAIITGTDASASPFGGDSNVYSDDVAQAFRAATEDKDVKAIVFRVSSPGGSDTASEQILAALQAAKKAGKPVVVSMGTYAASGGYWISSQADSIIAQPSTLTGSIGVYGGKFAIGEALARFGVDRTPRGKVLIALGRQPHRTPAGAGVHTRGNLGHAGGKDRRGPRQRRARNLARPQGVGIDLLHLGADLDPGGRAQLKQRLARRNDLAIVDRPEQHHPGHRGADDELLGAFSRGPDPGGGRRDIGLGGVQTSPGGVQRGLGREALIIQRLDPLIVEPRLGGGGPRRPLARHIDLCLRLLHRRQHHGERIAGRHAVAFVMQQAHDLSGIGRGDLHQLQRTHAADHGQRLLDRRGFDLENGDFRRPSRHHKPRHHGDRQDRRREENNKPRCRPHHVSLPQSPLRQAEGVLSPQRRAAALATCGRSL